MNDEMLMNNYLLLLKSTVEVYIHGTLESSNEDVRDLLKTNLNEILSSQASTYDLMTQYGFYNVNDVEVNEINKVLTNIESKN